MKRLFTLLLASAFTIASFAQAPIPNGDFESWNSIGGAQNPVRWKTADDVLTILPFNIQSPNLVVQDSTPANVASGSSSALLTTKGVTIPLLGSLTMSGSMSIGDYGFNVNSFTTLQVTLGGVAYTDRPDSIEFSYKYNIPSGTSDNGVVKFNLTRATPHDGTVTVGSVNVICNPTNGFVTAKAKVQYYSALAPDTLKIIAQSSNDVFGSGAVDGKLWLDNMRFRGLDTIFKAYLFPKSDQTRCLGDTIAIRTDEIPGNSYVWFLDGQPLPYTTYKIRIGTPGEYSVLVSHAGALWVSDTINLFINPLPVVTFTGYLDTLCHDDAPVELAGGSPLGGTYSGNGVRQNIFYPANASNGNKNLTYTYTDNNGCTASAGFSRFYIVDCTVGIREAGAAAEIHVYPNPAKNNLYITGNEKILGGTAKLYNVQGQLISTTALDSGNTALDLGVVGDGYYTVLVTDATGLILAKAKVTVVK